MLLVYDGDIPNMYGRFWHMPSQPSNKFPDSLLVSSFQFQHLLFKFMAATGWQHLRYWDGSIANLSIKNVLPHDHEHAKSGHSLGEPYYYTTILFCIHFIFDLDLGSSQVLVTLLVFPLVTDSWISCAEKDFQQRLQESATVEEYNHNKPLCKSTLTSPCKKV